MPQQKMITTKYSYTETSIAAIWNYNEITKAKNMDKKHWSWVGFEIQGNKIDVTCMTKRYGDITTTA